MATPKSTPNWHADAIKYARRMANVTTDLDRFQWLAILASLESLAAEVEAATAAEPPRKQARRLPMAEQVAKAA